MGLIKSKLSRIIFLLLLSAVVLSGCSLLDKDTKAGIQVITGDVASSIFLDGQYLEKTPLNEKNIQPGTYTLEIRPDDPNLVPYELQVTLRGGLLTVVTWKPGTSAETSGGVIYEMEPLKNKSDTEVSFVTIPDDAIITLDGARREFSPTTLTDIEPGQTEFEVVLPSYETQKHTINVVSGYRMLINIRLAKLNTYSQDSATQTRPDPDSSLGDQLDSAEATGSATTENEIAGPTVLIESTNFIVNGEEVLRVRDAASPAGSELGYAVVGQSYKYLGVSQNGWHQIEFESTPGWVSADYSQLVQ